MATPRVDFYVLAGADPVARLRFACRLVEKAYLRAHRVTVRFDPGGEATAFDDLLWTFADRSFVPHERLPADGAPGGRLVSAVLISDSESAEPDDSDLLVNLAAGVPAGYQSYPRIAEVIDGDGARRQLGRDRFRFYRDQGIQPETHELRDES